MKIWEVSGSMQSYLLDYLWAAMQKGKAWRSFLSPWLITFIKHLILIAKLLLLKWAGKQYVFCLAAQMFLIWGISVGKELNPLTCLCIDFLCQQQRAPYIAQCYSDSHNQHYTHRVLYWSRLVPAGMTMKRACLYNLGQGRLYKVKCLKLALLLGPWGVGCE